MKTDKKKLAAAALAYRNNHHWVPLRLEGKSPDCMGKGWQKRTLGDAIPQFEDGDNIGFLLGASSGGVIRLDPDFQSIDTVTDILFSELTAIFGRKSAKRSGRLHVCNGIKTTNFKLPAALKDDPRLPLHDGKRNLVIYQILSTGSQTVAPPSIHPESGEELTWVSDKKPHTLESAELLRRVGIEAFCMTVRQFWPPQGTRNEAAMALARVLLETFASRITDDAERIAVVDDLVEAIAMEGGDGEASRKGKLRAAATLERMRAGTETIGLSRLVELLEVPQPTMVKLFRRWLGLSSEREAALDGGAAGVSLDDFHAYMQMHSYIFAPTREMWPATSVNARIAPILLVNADGSPVVDDKGEQKKIPANLWLDQQQPVEQMTWAPGLPMLILDRLIADGGWIERTDVKCFNLYRPPTIIHGDAAEAKLWRDHVKKIYPDDAGHIERWLAQRVQRPQEKINHALVLGGEQGIGKDTLLEPVKRAIGHSNFKEASPQQTMGRFNGFLKSVILRVSEARDLGDVNRYQFYDHMKSYIASPPDVLLVDEKHLREHYVLNCTGVIITTNHKADGIYLPAEDRRHFVAWSALKKENFAAEYWNELWRYYNTGGDSAVAAYLAGLDLSKFNAKAPPPKTPAFWAIVNANCAPEESELADVLEKLKYPDAVTIGQVINACDTWENGFKSWLQERKNRRAIPHRFESCNYVPVRNEGAKGGLWIIGGVRQAIYAKAELSLRLQYEAATKLKAEAEKAKK